MVALPHRLLVLLAVAALALGACGGGDDEGPEEAARETSTTAGPETGTTDEDSTTTTAVASAGGAGTTIAGPATTTTISGATDAGPEEPAGEGVIEIAIVGGDVEGGVRREKVELGSQVTLRATSDVADELHVHTYDRTIRLVPGQSSDLTFLARIPGIHEVELHGRHKKVLELEVSA